MNGATNGRRSRAVRALRRYRSATLVVAVLGLLVALLAWQFPRPPRGEGDAAAMGPGEVVEGGANQSGPAEEPPPAGEGGNPPSGTAGVTKREPPANSAEPVRVSLGDGEQAVILGGRASLAVAFTQIGEEEFPSLRVEGDGPPKTLALLGPGGRVEFIAAGRHYVASVLRKDLAAKRLDLQVDARQ